MYQLTRLIRSGTRYPASSIRVQLVDLVVLDGSAAVVLGPLPFEGSAFLVHVGDLEINICIRLYTMRYSLLNHYNF